MSLIKMNIENRNLKVGASKLRAKGVIPGVLYGPSIENMPIESSNNELKKVMRLSGEIYQVLTKNGPVFVKFGEIQKDPVSHELLHFSLVQLPADEKNEVVIPVDFSGTPAGVKQGGVLVVMRKQLKISGTPDAIPDQIIGDISSLNIGDKLTINDLNIPNKVNAMDDGAEVVAVIRPPTKEVEPETATTEALNPEAETTAAAEESTDQNNDEKVA